MRYLIDFIDFKQEIHNQKLDKKNNKSYYDFKTLI